MALAFDLPQHLPRGGQPQDKATQILTKVGQTTNQSLNAPLAASWLGELDSTIRETKSRISKRIHDDLPAFDQQFESSVAIQRRLRDLSSNVDHIVISLNATETGILATLLRTLSAHEALTERANDSDVLHHALSHLLHIRDELATLSDWVKQGKLPEAAQACGRTHGLITGAPGLLDQAEVMSDVKKRYRTLNDGVQEQLSDAYARSIVFSGTANPTSLTIASSTIVPPTSTQITLSDILSSLAPDSLTSRLSTLRRDIMAKFVEPALLSHHSLTSSTADSLSTHTLCLSSASISPLHSIQTLVAFLESHFFVHLPASHKSFSSTFHSPITSAVLTHLLKTSIPSSLQSLPSFLGMVDEAVRFEKSLLPSDSKDKPIQRWADDVPAHYEKGRRETILRTVRDAVTGAEDRDTIRIEVSINASSASPALVEGQEDNNGSGWQFDGDSFRETAHTSRPGPSQSLKGADNEYVPTTTSQDHGADTRNEEDASDGWGWGDDADSDAEHDDGQSNALDAGAAVPNPDNRDDDPWDDDGWEAQPASPLLPEAGIKPEPEPKPLAPKQAPRMAKRLEKFSAKSKGLSASNTPVASPVVASASESSLARQAGAGRHLPPPLRPTSRKKTVKKETYEVSVRAKTILELAEGLMLEGQELMQSNVLAQRVSTRAVGPGHLLVTAAPSVLDLYRASYPVSHSSALARDANLAMRWSNDCRFLSEEVTNLRKRVEPLLAEEKWSETEERLKVLGEAWFEDVVVRQQYAVRNTLVGAQGFAEVAVAERFQECKSAIEQILQDITSVALQWKSTLTRSAYLLATGQVVDDALFRVMDDILSLEDIPEADSERLSELCELLAPLENLFVDDPGEPSVVGSHVPLWFKFSYLSWLIKGSIADLSYLFDQGMLVDYEIDELVRLLRALFAETPLRENTITKIAKGHPVSIQHDDY